MHDEWSVNMKHIKKYSIMFSLSLRFIAAQCEFDVCLLVSEFDGNTIEIEYESNTDLYGFQFDVTGTLLDDNAAMPGSIAIENNFEIENNSNTVLGYSISGGIIPTGSGTLASLHATQVSADEICIINLSTVNTAIENTSNNGSDCIQIESGPSFHFELQTGNNLISFPGIPFTTNTEELMNSLETQCGNQVGFLVGQGVGHFQLYEGTWNGNLNYVTPFSGYWINVSSVCSWELQLADGLSDGCIDYVVSGGNNLISYVGLDGVGSLDALGQNIDSSTPYFGNLDEHFNFIITEGRGSFNYCSGEGESCWSGNLNEVYLGKGYWINIGLNNYPYEVMRWNIGNGCDEPTAGLTRQSGNSNSVSNIPNDLQFTQSTEQAFYIIKELPIADEGDMILAYCENTHVGTAIWEGPSTPVPVMGRDLSPQTEGFCELGEKPEFILLKTESSQLTALEGEIAGFENLGVHKTNLTLPEKEIIPGQFMLFQAYPNPFNSETTVSFSIPGLGPQQNVTVEIYDLKGQYLMTLFNGTLNPGDHTVKWEAKAFPSSVYFVRMQAEEFQAQIKLQLIK